MLTDYERYQLEWMIEHGHSLKEFVQGLDLVDRDGIDSLEEAYAIWENDYGFGGEVFSNDMAKRSARWSLTPPRCQLRQSS